MDPALFRVFCEEFTRELNRLRMDGRAQLEAARSELGRIDRDLDRLVQALIDGVPAGRVKDRMTQLEARKAQLTELLAMAAPRPPDASGG